MRHRPLLAGGLSAGGERAPLVRAQLFAQAPQPRPVSLQHRVRGRGGVRARAVQDARTMRQGGRRDTQLGQPEGQRQHVQGRQGCQGEVQGVAGHVHENDRLIKFNSTQLNTTWPSVKSFSLSTTNYSYTTTYTNYSNQK